MQEQERQETIYLSTITVQEIEKGARLLDAKGASQKAKRITLFLDGLLAGYGDRILPVDALTAREAGRLEAKAVLEGHSPGAADALIAGTASIRGMIVVTRNLRHFRAFGIQMMSPDELSI